MTPLMRACCWVGMDMATFLLSDGANMFGKHRDADIRAGQFLNYTEHTFWYYCHWGFRLGDDLHPDKEAKLLEAAFQASESVGSKCLCPLQGFSPLTARLRRASSKSSYSRNKSFKNMIRYLNPQPMDIKR